MCGICGFRSARPVPLEKMANSLLHRGPDDGGVYRAGDVGLGHRRLSIIDVTPGGHQPMKDPGGKVTIVFNGEIYNYLELKEELKKQGIAFRSTSDTEVLLQMYLLHGREMLKHLNGEFAFVIHDARDNLLFGARDRLGIKPFYYTHNADGFFFASEIKALFESGFVKARGNPAAADMFFTYRYIPGRLTIYRDIYKLPPASAFEQKGSSEPVIWQYWDLPEEREHGDIEAAEEEFRQRLASAVRYRLISDVPLGVFLSGGVDSTTIVALMSELKQKPIRSFTVGFDMDIDETAEASRSALYYGCRQHLVKVPEDALDLLPKIIWHMDEPFGDPILIPTFLLSKAASKEVKAVLTGEGADEGQMGYIHHEALAKGLRLADRLPAALLPLVGGIIRRTPVSMLDTAFNYPSSMGTSGRERVGALFSRLRSPGSAYQLLTSLFTEEERDALYGPVLKQGKLEAHETYYGPLIKRIDAARSPMREIYVHDFKHWLPDNILNKQDRMTMANSIEGRVPFLDHRLVEFEAGLPQDFKLRNGKGKFLLNKLFNERFAVPGREMKKKKAFFMPMEGRFKKPYKDLVERYLRPSTLDDRLFNADAVARVIGNADRSPLIGHKQVMAIAMFQIWAGVFKPDWN